jgi:hypothetical protein
MELVEISCLRILPNKEQERWMRLVNNRMKELFERGWLRKFVICEENKNAWNQSHNG